MRRLGRRLLLLAAVVTAGCAPSAARYVAPDVTVGAGGRVLEPFVLPFRNWL